MPEVDMVPAVMKTATMDRPMVTSYEIICAVDRKPPSNGYVDPDAQPPSTMPYTPIAEHASTTSTATGTSVTCNAVWCPKMLTIGPKGTTDSAVSAVTAETVGAKKNTTLSAVRGSRSSLSMPLMPSASVCSRPSGPVWFRPGRTAIRATTRRSNQTPTRIMLIPKMNTTTTLISTSHHGSWPKLASVGSLAST